MRPIAVILLCFSAANLFAQAEEKPKLVPLMDICSLKTVSPWKMLSSLTTEP